ncbi:hypothetical protein [Azospirillum sp. TSH100]|uniref:TRADD-N-associated membrane domain-containing protein n=1 Tax=Azospirillum sp. TSH100 TaxID=652764 RepID=UPI0010A9BBDC|nr:hypothetical protein [Azospirillum sp. TSH100]QCG89352.1 hypothetical protein E6C72_16305 [Azospirillum sp. TSH100]
MSSEIISWISEIGGAASVAAALTGIAGIAINALAERQKKAQQRKLQIELISKNIFNSAMTGNSYETVKSDKSEVTRGIENNHHVSADKFSFERETDRKDNSKLVEDLVTNYHQQALSQARVQFLFSIFAATIGFIYIMYASYGIDDANMLTVVKILPGVIVDAIAALFFRQAEQTRQRATELYDRLRKDQQMQRAEAIVESIGDDSIKSAIKAQIALHMAGLSPKEIDIHSFIKTAEISQ